MIYTEAYFACNFGDDLMVRTLLNNFPDVKFYLCGEKSKLRCFNDLNNVVMPNKIESFVTRVNRKLFKSRIDYPFGYKQSDVIVKIGGSIFIEYNGWERNYSVFDKPTFILGCNFGPYKTESFLNATRERIKHVEDCCFRDSYSYSLFFENSKARLATDIVFAYDELPEVNHDASFVGISVIDFMNRGELAPHMDAYETGIIEICLRYIHLGKKIKFFNFCSMEGDRLAINRIISTLSELVDNISHYIEIVDYDGDHKYMLNEMNQCHIIYATLFHAMIVGWLLRKKVAPIIYSRKQLNILNDMGYNEAIWNIGKGDSLDFECLAPRALSKEKIESLKNNAYEQFLVLKTKLR